MYSMSVVTQFTGSELVLFSYPTCFLSWKSPPPPPPSEATSDWTLLSVVSQLKCCSSRQCQDGLHLHAKQTKFWGGLWPLCVCRTHAVVVSFFFLSWELPFYCPHWLPLYPTFFFFFLAVSVYTLHESVTQLTGTALLLVLFPPPPPPSIPFCFLSR